MNSPKLSVIIPVYNVADYLEKCLFSVTNQTLKDIEIIVVNDGSTDNSLSIVEKYAALDDRIMIINKQNDGVSYARKTGVEMASGEYIHFLDGDDFIELNCYEVLCKEAMEHEADMVFMKFWFQEGVSLSESKSYGQERNDKFALLTRLWLTTEYYCVWQYIHKRSLYNNPVTFEKLSIGEDAILTTQLIYYSQKISFLESPLYHYIIRNTSATNGNVSDKRVKDLFLYSKIIREFMHCKPEYEKYKEVINCTHLTSLRLVLGMHYFKGLAVPCRKAVALKKEYPQIYHTARIHPLRKLITLFAFQSFLGRLYAKYYISKGKL